jgi:hypothetical protein
MPTPATGRWPAGTPNWPAWPSSWGTTGKRAYEEHANPPGPYHLFRLDLHEVVLTSLHPDGDRIVIETWRPGQPLQRTERR